MRMGFGASRRLTLPYGRRSGWRWGFGCCLRHHPTGASMRLVAMSIASRTIPCQFPAITTHEARLAEDGARVQCSWRAEALIQGPLSGQSKPTTGASTMNPARASRRSGQSRSRGLEVWRSGTTLDKPQHFSHASVWHLTIYRPWPGLFGECMHEPRLKVMATIPGFKGGR